MDRATCASHHFGPWMIEPQWFRDAVSAVQSGLLKADTRYEKQSEDDLSPYKWEVINGVAVLPIAGATMKIRSKYGGTSSVDVRNAIRKAAADDNISAILLHIDSPGGTVAGTDALARDVADANKRKPVYAHIEDMGASAAYYVASQTRRITASPTSLVGSLGTRMAIVDSSEAAASEGLRVYDISTGEFKGAGLEGTKITDRQLAYFQSIVDEGGKHFKAAVMLGRGFDQAKTDALFDGRVHDAEVAKQLGLIDEVSTFDAAMAAIQEESYQMTREQIDAFAAEHPEAVASYVEQGRKAGHSAAIAEFKAIREACGPDNLSVAADAFETGQSIDSAKSTVAAVANARAEEAAKMAAKDAEIAALKAQVEQAQFVAGTQGAVGAKPATDAKAAGKTYGSPKEQAEAEYDESAEIRQNFISKEVYVAARVMDLNGRVSINTGGRKE